MRWVAISGSWRTVNFQVEQDVRDSVAEIYRRGDGIVTGGAPGVDYIATDESLRHDPQADRLKIIIPVPLSIFVNHYFRWAEEKIISNDLAQNVTKQLLDVKSRNPLAVEEMDQTECNPTTYYNRNGRVIESAHELFAFQVNNSQGTQDAIDKARACGMPVRVWHYEIK